MNHMNAVRYGILTCVQHILHISRMLWIIQLFIEYSVICGAMQRCNTDCIHKSVNLMNTVGIHTPTCIHTNMYKYVHTYTNTWALNTHLCIIQQCTHTQYMHSARNITVSHWPFSSIWLTKIYCDRQTFSQIFKWDISLMAYKIFHLFKNSWPISDPYF